jgi:ectoine hydroxylase-related dioxygenase (phytanoyl-CoA dioxygenase family)
MAHSIEDVDWRSRITPQVVHDLHNDGVIHVPGLVHPLWLQLIEMGITRILSISSRKQTFFKGEGGEFIDTVRNFEITPEFQRLLYDSPLADVAMTLFGTDRVWLLFDHVFVKDGGDCQRTPWHQDLTYWPVAGEMLASMWITLDPIPKHECLEYIRGSHRQTLYDGFDPPRSGEDPTLPFYGQGFPRLPNIEAEREKWDIVSWDITPGDVIIFHPGVLHGGGPTSEGRRRRTLSVRFFGEDVVFAERPRTRPTAPRTPGLELLLKPGDPLRHPYYPRLRPLPPHQRADYYE